MSSSPGFSHARGGNLSTDRQASAGIQFSSLNVEAYMGRERQKELTKFTWPESMLVLNSSEEGEYL